jgi:superfamily II DNA helicase RecQ
VCRFISGCCADYKKLGVLKQQFPDTPIIALTATATMQVSHVS